MIHISRKGRFLALTALILSSGGALVYAQNKETPSALPAEQVIAAIRAAIGAKPGQILEVESEAEKGVTSCEVKILAADGKIYEVTVNAATSQVTGVELDDDGNETQSEQDDD